MSDHETWQPGRALGTFRLAERIGRGGMGEVWLARDETLGRDVALKFVPPEYARDAGRLERFEREARVLAKLDHPGIARIHGFHDVEGTRFFEMEYVPGEDLAQRIERGPVDPDAAVELAVAICEALAAAHARGIVHRDLKPANVRLAPDGRVKVVDFGLARALVEGESADPELSPTRTTPATAAGVLLGTAAYMSPEQARGRPVDARTDLWALGCVLYECLAGRRAFEGETVSDTLAAILRGEPDPDALPDRLSPRLLRVLDRCLAKDPDDRWRDAGDVALLLDDVRRGGAGAGAEGAGGPGGPGSGAASPGARTARRLATALGGGALLVAGLVAGMALQKSRQPPAGERRPVRTTLEFPEDLYISQARISPDGRWIAAAGGDAQDAMGQQLWVRDLAEDAPRRIDVDLLNEAVRFSPDSREVAVALRSLPGSTGPVLARVPLDGSALPTAIAPVEDGWIHDAVWMRDGDLVLCDEDAATLIRIPTDGRPRPAPVPVRADPGVTDRREILVHSEGPDGRILATVQAWDGGYHQDIVIADPDTGEVRLLVDRGAEPVWLPPDRLVFSRSDRLLSVGFDPERMEVVGSPTTVESGLRTRVEMTFAGFSLSDRGDLVHLPGGVVGDRRRLTVADASGGRELWPEAVGPFTEALDDSEDGRVIGVTRVGATGLYEAWASELLGSPFERVVALPDMDCFGAVVSPRGRFLASYCLGDEERNGIYFNRFPPTGTPERIFVPEDAWTRGEMYGWVPDGSGYLIRSATEGAPPLLIPFDENGPTGQPPVPIEGLGTGVEGIAVSRDARLVAVIAGRGQRTELRIGRWNDGRPTGLRTVADELRGSGMDWSGEPDPRGRVLIYTGADGVRRGVVDDDGRLLVSEPTTLASHPDWPMSMRNAFLPDGRVVRMEIDEEEAVSRQVRLVLDWASGLPDS